MTQSNLESVTIQNFDELDKNQSKISNQIIESINHKDNQKNYGSLHKRDQIKTSKSLTSFRAIFERIKTTDHKGLDEVKHEDADADADISDVDVSQEANDASEENSGGN